MKWSDKPELTRRLEELGSARSRRDTEAAAASLAAGSAMTEIMKLIDELPVADWLPPGADAEAARIQIGNAIKHQWRAHLSDDQTEVA